MSSAPTLVNSIYPVGYFSLPGVDQIKYPDTSWWSSKSRFASIDDNGNYLANKQGGFLTSEILEIDLGRTRGVNYINFDVIRAPLTIKVEYDLLSSPDRSDAVWAPVSRVDGLPFDDGISFDADVRSSWFNAEFNFTDTKGNLVHSRYLRITFTRQDLTWPTATAPPFDWPVFVKHLRIGRYIGDLRDTTGPLLNQETPLNRTALILGSASVGLTTFEARQQFVIPTTTLRAGVTPNMLGFGVLIQTVSDDTPFDQSGTGQVVSMQWSLWDVTNQAQPVNLRSGIATGAIVPGTSWLDFYLDDAQIVPGDTTKIYELRIFSLNQLACETVFTTSPSALSSTPIPGTLTFTNNSTIVGTSQDVTSVVAVGSYLVRNDIPGQVYKVNAITSSQITLNTPFTGTTSSSVSASIIFPFASYDTVNQVYTQDGTRNMVMRVWGDVADEGRDVLGNAYRYVVRRQQAEYVQDGTKAGWMSDPVPTPDAVESLYFDVRSINSDGQPTMSLIEAVQIAPRTPGVRMNVYYSQENLSGEVPATTNDWDYLLWVPIQESYTLHRNEIIQLPTPIRAAFIKLEFTALNPLPYQIPTYPPLPPKLYRRFPTWVEDQFNNAQVRNLIEGWFLRNATPVEVQVLQSLTSPILEFQYQQREFLAALALGEITDSQVINSNIVDVQDRALIDPVTASKIYLSTLSDFKNSLILSVDPTSVLGQAVIQRFDPTKITDPLESTPASSASTIPVVSTTNDRISESYQNMTGVPMRFNLTTRHEYTVEQAEFNKKAYFVGIEKVAFLRNNYVVMHDDTLITETLADDLMVLQNTFQAVVGTTIPDGTTLYASYVVGSTQYTDEAVFLSGDTAVQLAGTGGPVRNLVLFAQPNKQGLQYWQNDDYELSQQLDDTGTRVTLISRSSLTGRLATPLQALIFVDAATVIGIGVIPSPPVVDESMATGVAVVSGIDGPFVPDYGTGTYGGMALYSPYGFGDYGDGTYGSAPTTLYGLGTYGFGVYATGLSASGTYGDLAGLGSDGVIVKGVGQPSESDTDTGTDAATVIGVAVVSGTDTYTP